MTYASDAPSFPTTDPKGPLADPRATTASSSRVGTLWTIPPPASAVSIGMIAYAVADFGQSWTHPRRLDLDQLNKPFADMAEGMKVA